MVKTAVDSRRWKYFKTCALNGAFCSLGLAIALLGPTLPTLAYNLHVIESSLSFIFTVRACGYLFGSIISAILIKKMDPHLLIAICLTVTAIGNLIIPLAPTSIILSIMLFASSLSMGVLDTAGNVMCLQIWGTESETWMQTLHFFFAFGATLAPLTAKPFINEVSYHGEATDDDRNATTISYASSTVVNTLPATLESSNDWPYVVWCFAIAAALSLTVAVVFYFLACISRKNPSTSCQEDTAVEEGKRFRTKLLALLFIFFMLYVGTEVAFGLFIYSFAINSEKHYSKSEGTLLNSIFWGAFAAGRFFAIFFTKCFTPKGMIIFDMSGTAIATLTMSLFPYYSNNCQYLLWAAVALYGWSMASLFPSGISWGERYITMTGRAASVLVVGGALGEMALPFLIGNIINQNPMNLMYFCLISTFICIFNFLVMLKIASKRGLRHKSNKHEREIVELKDPRECVTELHTLLEEDVVKRNALPLSSDSEL